MKRKMISSIVVLFALLVYFSGRAFAREIQKGDDRRGNNLPQSSQLLSRSESQPADDRGSSQGTDDLPGDDKGGQGQGTDDLPGDDKGGQSHGADDLPGDDKGGQGHGADDLPGDDNGGRTQVVSTWSLLRNIPQLHDDHVRRDPSTDDRSGLEDILRGRGADNPASDDNGGSTQVSSTTTPAKAEAQPLDDRGARKHGGDDPKGHK